MIWRLKERIFIFIDKKKKKKKKRRKFDGCKIARMWERCNCHMKISGDAREKCESFMKIFGWLCCLSSLRGKFQGNCKPPRKKKRRRKSWKSLARCVQFINFFIAFLAHFSASECKKCENLHLVERENRKKFITHKTSPQLTIIIHSVFSLSPFARPSQCTQNGYNPDWRYLVNFWSKRKILHVNIDFAEAEKFFSFESLFLLNLPNESNKCKYNEKLKIYSNVFIWNFQFFQYFHNLCLVTFFLSRKRIFFVLSFDLSTDIYQSTFLFVSLVQFKIGKFMNFHGFSFSVDSICQERLLNKKWWFFKKNNGRFYFYAFEKLMKFEESSNLKAMTKKDSIKNISKVVKISKEFQAFSQVFAPSTNP